MTGQAGMASSRDNIQDDAGSKGWNQLCEVPGENATDRGPDEGESLQRCWAQRGWVSAVEGEQGCTRPAGHGDI